ncbi:MAG: UDP-glucose/GDP-mannose dehydrogenase family protein [Spirochaetaceae bacterium]|jgi:UDPglucose 6-dehydrogenase|nr:UDP-glucose/GDP-mannose dehydrogenase family protein [Spirochaetaceae bacterium]
MASVAIIGTGYVGLVSGACLADFGNIVTCVDIDEKKINRLKKGEIPIYEPGLQDVVTHNLESGRLCFSTSLEDAAQKNDVIFIAVGTPPAEDGSADLSYVENAARAVGKIMNGYKIIVDKSTVPVGTGKKVTRWISEELKTRERAGDFAPDSVSFDVVSNPEFLREGSAVQDFMHPDRIVIGTESYRARGVMKDVYRSLYLNETPYIETNLESAEMIKYAANAFLAVKISFINEIANLCEATGANIQDVAKGVGRDGRIGGKFLHPGPGYGGSCFPKDTQALSRTGRESACPLSIVDAAIQANDAQKQKMLAKIERGIGSLKNKKIAMLGLSFKPNTDDMREAPALTVITGLASGGAVIHAADPAALAEAKWRLKDVQNSVVYFEDEYKAIEGADALVIMTEWNQYRNLDIDRVKNLLKTPVFFDLRNIYKRADIEKKGFVYFAVGQ